MTIRWKVLLASCAAAAAHTSAAADRQIGVDPMLSVHWGTLTGGPTTPAAQMGNNMMVGFWQRSSGAKAGVGSINTGVVEFQLPENPPQRIRSATLQFRARASQCSGAEPVVFEVFGYAGNGKADPADALSGVRLGRLTANCTDNPAFTQVIDASNLVRQLSVPSGLRFAGFNVRKMNHRAGPSYFGFSAAKLTIVVASEDLAIAPSATFGGGATGAPEATAAPGGNTQLDAGKVIAGLAGAAATLLRGAGQQPAREQARNEAAEAISNPTSTVPGSTPTSGATPAPATEGAPLDVAASPAPMAAGSPAPMAAASAPMAATAAPVAAVGSAINVDIVGIRLGMSQDEVKRALQAHSPGMRVDETRGIVNNVAATDYLSWIIARGSQRGSDGSGDAIGVHFPPPPNAHRAIFVERFTGFPANQYPLFETLKQALVKKYGPPSFASEGVMLWTFNAAGVQIVDNNVNARCAKFPPTDPPARGQNVMFNGYKTAGCGTTVYVRYERNRGPSNSDTVRWMSVSLVDDSQFEDMRQAAARFATQATRESASRVAAPKL
jgi:hypothetical protein